jgi:hypothetical protein
MAAATTHVASQRPAAETVTAIVTKGTSLGYLIFGMLYMAGISCR